MIYQYACESCGIRFDVIKSHRDMERPEHCQCGMLAKREFIPQRVFFSNTSVQHPEFNPGLGCIVKNKQHRSEICKARGLEEIGSEPVESIHKHYDTRRAEKIEKAYDEADRGWVGDGTS